MAFSRVMVDYSAAFQGEVMADPSLDQSAINNTENNSSLSSPFFDEGDPSLMDSARVAELLNVDISQGLTEEEVDRRQEKFGLNELSGAPPVPRWKKFIAQFRDPLVYLLLVATLISLGAWFVERAHSQTTGEGAEILPFDAIVIVLILIVNAILGYIQEARAEQAVEALSQMSAPHASVLRGGSVHRIPTNHVVPGDVLVLGEGDSVCADARLFTSASLRVAEASLTGESLPVSKKADILPSAKALGDRSNMVFNGTSVTQGTGRAIVTSTGMNTQVGKIAHMLSQSEDGPTPLQKEMEYVSKILGIAVSLIAVVVLLSLALLEGFKTIDDIIDSLLLSVSLAVAAVPEGLAAILTVVLALSVQRMAKHHAIVKRLSSVETLGSTSVICSDKTGTLTKNEMTVECVVTPSGRVNVTGTGYGMAGRLVADTEDSDPIAHEVELEALRTLAIGALVNDSEIRRNSSSPHPSSNTQAAEWEVLGDPTEISLAVAAAKTKAFKRLASYTRVADIPFTSDRKRMSIVAKNDADSGKLSVFSKGAPDVLLEFCTHIAYEHNICPITEEDRNRILQQVDELSSQAYRTLGQAYRPLEVTSLADIEGIHTHSFGQVIDVSEQDDILEKNMIWAGMAGIIDPPRTEVRSSVAEAHRAGIRTVMITGDHPLTAARIASDLGIVSKQDSLTGQALTGDELDNITDQAEFDRKISEVNVFARVAPEHKLKIVESLQRQGNISAMTGDGVNDAPAVKKADIGVAMGITGTEVTKQSAKMILGDDNFSTIVAAVREGRGIFDNIQKFLRYLLSSNVGEVLTVFGGVVFGGLLGITLPDHPGVVVPLLATQLLWINLLTDAAPALAMGVDPAIDNVMTRSPRKLTDRAIDKGMWGDIIFTGIIMAAVTLIGMDMHLAGGFFTDRSLGGDHARQLIEARTVGFTILVLAQMFNALASRSHTKSLFSGLFTNRWLWGALALSFVLQLVVIYIPFLNQAFGTVPLTMSMWVECFALSLIVLVASELRKIALRFLAKNRANK